MRKSLYRGKSLRYCAISATAASVFVFAGSAYGQYASDFEGLNASAAGEILTGQDGYYIPACSNPVQIKNTSQEPVTLLIAQPAS